MSGVRNHPIAEPEPRAAETASGAPLPVPHSALAGLRIPELLAPAGDWACARAAVENGADAIYFGLEQFNARMRADNFTEADLPKLIEFLHRRGVKGYVTLNTLVFENEMAQAEACLRSMIVAGVDAVVVQDAGICRLIRRLSPDFPIHASTQMTITSAAGVEFARQLGCNLVVLARECSLKEIEKIAAPDAPQAGPAGPEAGAGRPGHKTRRRPARVSQSRSSSTAPCASPIPANALPARPWADARPTAANAPRPAACPTN